LKNILWFVLFLVVNIESLSQSTSSDYRIGTGCTYLINNNIQFDVSDGVGLNAVAPDSFVAFGLAWRLDR